MYLRVDLSLPLPWERYDHTGLVMNIILFGCPGVGKGTQAELLAARLGFPHISTGAIFREAIKSGSELGAKVKEYTEGGMLVPDELTTAVALEALRRPEAAAGFILDGFPRNCNQAEALVEALASENRSIDRVIYLIAPDEELIQRMLRRGRLDDNEDVIRRRLEIYQNETAPVLEFFRRYDNVTEIEGVGDVNEVQDRILSALLQEQPSSRVAASR
jgi:adenylate kinase